MTTSYIEPHEEQEAKDLVTKHLGFEPPKAAGYNLAVKIYIRPEEVSTVIDNQGVERKIYLTESSRAEDKYKSITALVISMGPECYKGERFEHSGPWCQVGDWVVIPRHEGTQIVYRDIPMHIIPDDRILMVVDDPAVVRRD
jgi:co-chaperonin GroES (HSP10)